MAKKEYYEGLKYHCNHPESDFIDNSKGPIEMKKEKFVEYTHRNDRDRTSDNSVIYTTSQNSLNKNSFNKSSLSSNDRYSNNRSYNRTTSSSYSKPNQKSTKNNSVFVIVILLVIYVGIPVFFNILGLIIEAIASFL